jgi:hypothetical protein
VWPSRRKKRENGSDIFSRSVLDGVMIQVLQRGDTLFFIVAIATRAR